MQRHPTEKHTMWKSFLLLPLAIAFLRVHAVQFWSPTSNTHINGSFFFVCYRFSKNIFIWYFFFSLSFLWNFVKSAYWCFFPCSFSALFLSVRTSSRFWHYSQSNKQALHAVKFPNTIKCNHIYSLVFFFCLAWEYR